MCDYSKLNGKGRERRRPGTAAEPEVTLSTWDAYGQGRARDQVRAGPGTRGHAWDPNGEDRDPGGGMAVFA